MTQNIIQERVQQALPTLAHLRAKHDQQGSFAQESCVALKEAGLYKALVPVEFGGLGASLTEMCDALRALAHACPAASLTLSMHSHLVAATVWKHKQGQAGAEPLLRKVAEQGVVLVSTGAGDWLQSGGELTRVEGGYRFTAKKGFCSGSPIGDIMVTSGCYDDPERGPRVLHFPVPYASEGVTRGSDWQTHGMRGTGSDTTHLANVFVPEASIAIDRPRGEWHPAFDVICAVALPLIMSTYVGIAERAQEIALSATSSRTDDNTTYLVGELENELVAVHALHEAHVRNTAEYDFTPDSQRTHRSLCLKTNLADACIRCVSKAMEVAGGRGFFSEHGLEQLMRDVRAAPYHPLPTKPQQRFVGRARLGLPPVG